MDNKNTIERIIKVTTRAIEGKRLEPLSLVHILDLAHDG